MVLSWDAQCITYATVHPQPCFCDCPALPPFACKAPCHLHGTLCRYKGPSYYVMVLSIENRTLFATSEQSFTASWHHFHSSDSRTSTRLLWPTIHSTAKVHSLPTPERTHPSNTKRVPVGSPGFTSMVSVRISSEYSPSAWSTLRLCCSFFKQPWKISSRVSSTAYCGGRGAEGCETGCGIPIGTARKCVPLTTGAPDQTTKASDGCQVWKSRLNAAHLTAHSTVQQVC